MNTSEMKDAQWLRKRWGIPLKAYRDTPKPIRKALNRLIFLFLQWDGKAPVQGESASGAQREEMERHPEHGGPVDNFPGEEVTEETSAELEGAESAYDTET